MPGNEKLESVRMDRWLFSVRIFKTRSMASKAVDGGKVKANGVTVKAHKLVHIGDVINYKREGQNLEYKVLGLLDKRVGAKDAMLCYEVTEDADLSEEQRATLKIFREADRKVPRSEGKPSKRDRRQMERFRDVQDQE